MPPTQIGRSSSTAWFYDSTTGVFDLTRNDDKSFSEDILRLKTTTHPIDIDPGKTALIIIDMQNFFLSPDLGRPVDGPAMDVAKSLQDGIPLAREKGIRIVWANWGLTDEDLNTMPPATVKAFQVLENDSAAPHKKKKNPALYRGLGSDLGQIELANGTTVDAGELLMRGTWNTELYGPLADEYRHGRERANRPDVWVSKNRMSGLWSENTFLQQFLEKEGITTLLFSGVNTDQCVGGTLIDAFSKGYDCVLLKDAVATTSPQFATDSWEWNCSNTYGFVSSLDALRG